MQVVAGSYPGVRTAELDELLAETAAYLATDHYDYSMLAARVAVSALHKVTEAKFSEKIARLNAYVHPSTGEKSPKIADNIAAVVVRPHPRCSRAAPAAVALLLPRARSGA
jgi:hypothetical protein